MSKVTVCIPTYRRPELVKLAIDSCFRQSFEDVDVFVSDDSPDCDTADMIHGHPCRERITYVRNSPGLGQAQNVNFLFSRCESEYLVLLHDDDLLFPTAIEVMIAPLQKLPAVVASFGKQCLISNSGTYLEKESEELARRYFKTEKEADQIQDSAWSALVQQFPNDTYMVRTSAARRTLYRDLTEVSGACDADFGFRLAELGPFYFSNHLTGAYRISTDSVSSDSLRSSLGKLFLLIQQLPLPEKLEEARCQRLTGLAQTAVTGLLLDGNKRAAAAVLMSKYYGRKNWFSARAASQLVMLAAPKCLVRKVERARHPQRT